MHWCMNIEYIFSKLCTLKTNVSQVIQFIIWGSKLVRFLAKIVFCSVVDIMPLPQNWTFKEKFLWQEPFHIFKGSPLKKKPKTNVYLVLEGFLDFFKGSPLWKYENKSCLNELKFWEVSQNRKPSKFWKFQLSTYLMWNLKICQNAPSQGQDDLVLWIDHLVLKLIY